MGLFSQMWVVYPGPETKPRDRDYDAKKKLHGSGRPSTGHGVSGEPYRDESTLWSRHGCDPPETVGVRFQTIIRDE